MASPIAIVGAPQTFAFADLPQVVALDGTSSTDPDGDPITAYQWTAIDVPPGSAAVLNDATDPQPTFTADLPGTYLFLLQVTAGVEQSEGDYRLAPSSALALVSVTTQHLALTLPASGERDWADRHNANWAAMDDLGGTVADYDLSAIQAAIEAAQAAADAAQADADTAQATADGAQTDATAAQGTADTALANAAAAQADADTAQSGADAANAAVGALATTVDGLNDTLTDHINTPGAHWGPATDAAVGVVQLSAASTTPATPVVICQDDPDWQTLTDGSVADALHTHSPGRPGYHNLLRPDLLVGGSDVWWADPGAVVPFKTDAAGGERAVEVGITGDGLLKIEIGKEATEKIAGAFWTGIAGAFVASVDLRLEFDGPISLDPAETGHTIYAGFAWVDVGSGDDFNDPRLARGAGLVIDNDALGAMQVGVTATAARDWNAGGATLIEGVADVGPITQIGIRVVRTASAMWAEVSLGGGGWVRVNDTEWDPEGGKEGVFCLFGSAKGATEGLRIKSTGMRVTALEVWGA